MMIPFDSRKLGQEYRMSAARWSRRGSTARAKMKMFLEGTSLVPRRIASSPSYFSERNTEAVG